MNSNIIEVLDYICDSEQCFNDRSFDEIQLPYKENVARLLLQETEEKFNRKILSLGYKDKRQEQVYDELKGCLLETELQFSKYFGEGICFNGDGIRELIFHASQNINNKRGIFLKEEVARNILLEIPPINLISLFKFDNIHELMDNEDIYTIYSAVRVSESSMWTSKLYEIYKTLKFCDFEERDIRVRIFDTDKFSFLVPILLKKQTIWEDKMLGTIFGIPIPNIERCPIPNIRILTRAYHYYYELLFHSRFIEYISTCKNFGERFSNVIKGKHLYYNFFEPHCLSEYLYWVSTYEQLGKYIGDIPSLDLWLDSFYTGGFMNSSDGQNDVISFNLLDVLTNVSKSKVFPGNTRILAMAIKGKLFELLCGDKDKAEKRILENLDKGHIALE